MSSSDKIAYKIEGLEDVADRLAELSLTVQNRIVRESATTAMEPAVAEAKARCPKDTGNLAESIGLKKVKSRGRYKKGLFVLSLGPRQGFGWAYEGGTRENLPFKYGVPVEYGHVMKNGMFKPAAAFLRETYYNQRDAIVERFAKAMRDAVGIQIVKLEKKKARAAAKAAK